MHYNTYSWRKVKEGEAFDSSAPHSSKDNAIVK